MKCSFYPTHSKIYFASFQTRTANIALNATTTPIKKNPKSRVSVRIIHSQLMAKRLKSKPQPELNCLLVSFFSYNAAHLASLCIVLVSIDALGSTKGYTVAQQASTSCCKGVHPYSSPALNKTQRITMGIHSPIQCQLTLIIYQTGWMQLGILCGYFKSGQSKASKEIHNQ